ncbi:MAG: SAM-dependent methyltransferase, partial [Clostridiales bacterium]|nr:SAM-dependent methyltransferase [Clostridiales bacterium]
MVLSARLQLIYDMIPQCSILSDIGTDHAYIPAYALLNNRCVNSLACDLRAGPLERAQRTRKKYMLENKMELRLGSGLEPIEEHEADVIIMAGMGSYLITELIDASLQTAQRANYLILQPMTGQEIIRPYLWEKGFEIIDEGLTNEGRKLYQVMLIKYTGKIREDWDRINEFVGEKLVDKKDPL